VWQESKFPEAKDAVEPSVTRRIVKPKYILLTKDRFGLMSTGGAVYQNDTIQGGHNVTTLFDSVEAAKDGAAKFQYKNFTIAAFVMDVEQVPRYDTKETLYSN
jgi:hypothetical protein